MKLEEDFLQQKFCFLGKVEKTLRIVQYEILKFKLVYLLETKEKLQVTTKNRMISPFQLSFLID
jgi:hypothetical protein